MQRKNMQSILWSVGTSRVKNRRKSLMTLATAHRISSSPKSHSLERGAGEGRGGQSSSSYALVPHRQPEV